MERAGLVQFSSHLGWDREGDVKPLQQVCFSDLEQARKRRGVGDDHA